MTEEATDLHYLGIQAAEFRHTPDLKELKVRRHNQLKYGMGPVNCDGELEVIGVTAAYHNYNAVFVNCKKCQMASGMKNPRATVTMTKNETPDWKKRKDTGDGVPF